jgi:hypothetical protein
MYTKTPLALSQAPCCGAGAARAASRAAEAVAYDRRPVRLVAGALRGRLRGDGREPAGGMIAL